MFSNRKHYFIGMRGSGTVGRTDYLRLTVIPLPSPTKFELVFRASSSSKEQKQKHLGAKSRNWAKINLFCACLDSCLALLFVVIRHSLIFVFCYKMRPHSVQMNSARSGMQFCGLTLCWTSLYTPPPPHTHTTSLTPINTLSLFQRKSIFKRFASKEYKI